MHLDAESVQSVSPTCTHIYLKNVYVTVEVKGCTGRRSTAQKLIYSFKDKALQVWNNYFKNRMVRSHVLFFLTVRHAKKQLGRNTSFTKRKNELGRVTGV